MSRIPRGVAAAGEDVERVEAGAEVGVVAGLDDPPGVVVVAHMAPPGERLVGDPDVVRSGTLGERVQLRGGESIVIERVRRDVGAHEQHVRAELLHDRELALRAAQVRLEALLGHRLEVTQGLIQRDLQPELLGSPADLRGSLWSGDEVGLEELDGVEARGRGRVELVLERAAQADRGDRPAHLGSLAHAAWIVSATSSSTWCSIRSRSGRIAGEQLE